MRIGYRQRRCGRSISGHLRTHLPGEGECLLDEGLHDLGLGYGLDDPALDEDLAFSVAGGDAEVGVAGFAGAVDDAAHDGDPQRYREPVERGRDLFGQLVQFDLGPAAGRAGHDVEATSAQPERFEDGDAGLDLLDGWGGQRYPDGVADALAKQRAERDGGLYRALVHRAGLGDAQVQRVVAALGE